MTTLEEAVALGRGVERPFRCHEHDDSSASASVNVVKMVWVCYACQAKGVVDGKRVPTTDELLAMLEPEQACRELPQAWLDVYSWGGYWLDRFPDWLCWYLSLGEDPWTGEGTYPVHTPGGRLAGIAKRSAMAGPGPKYLYPPVWSASRSMFGSRGRWPVQDYLVLTEGAADTAAVLEAGVPALACYGAGLHKPQVALVKAMRPQLVLCGFDMDEAGERATAQSYEALSEFTEVGFITWPGKDPAESPVEARLEAILEAVVPTHYGAWDTVASAADGWLETIKKIFVEETNAQV